MKTVDEARAALEEVKMRPVGASFDEYRKRLTAYALAVLDRAALIPQWYESDTTLDELDEFKALRKELEELGR